MSTTEFERETLGAFPLADGDTAVDIGVDRFLRGRSSLPLLLGLGEPTHGVEGFLRLRNDIFRSLVERHGYRAIALEANCLSASILDDYARGADIALDEAMEKGFSLGFGAFAGNRSLFAWLREHNAKACPQGQVRVHGFDAPIEMTRSPNPRVALVPLHEYLTTHGSAADPIPSREELDELLGEDAAWSNPAELIGRSTEAAALRVLADNLAAVLQRATPRLVAESGPEKLRRARLHARTAIGLLRYHAALATGGRGLAMGARDAMMADNLLDIVQTEAQRGPVLAFAHNGHLQRHEIRIAMGDIDMRWWGAGSIVATALGARYAYIASDHAAPGEAHPGSFQHLLGQSIGDRALLISQNLPQAVRHFEPAPSHSSHYVYSPVDPRHLDSIDAIAFLGRRAGAGQT